MITKIKDAFDSLRAIWGRFRTGRSGNAVFWYAGSSLICQVLRFAALLWMMKFLGDVSWNDWGKFQLVLGLSMITANLGQNEGLVALKPGENDLYGFQILCSLAGGLLSIPLSYGLVQHFAWTNNRIAELWWLIPLTVLLSIFSMTAAMHAQREFRFKRIAFSSIASLAVYFATVLILSTQIDDFRVFVAAQLAELAILLLLTGSFIPWRSLSSSLSRKSFDYYCKRFIPATSPQILIGNLSANLNLFLLNRYASAQIGLYEQVQRLVQIPMSVSINLIDRPILVLAAERQEDSPAIRRLLLLSLLVVPCIAGAACAVVYFGFLVLGPRYLEEARFIGIKGVLPFFLIPAILQPIAAVTRTVMIGTGKAKSVLLSSITILAAKAAVGVPLVMLGHGAIGIALAIGAGALAGIFVDLYLLRVSLHQPEPESASDLAAVAVAEKRSPLDPEQNQRQGNDL